MKKFISILKMIYEGQVKPEYYSKLYIDQITYGASYQQLIKPNFFNRIIRRIKRLPIDTRRIDPKNVKLTQPLKKPYFKQY